MAYVQFRRAHSSHGLPVLVLLLCAGVGIARAKTRNSNGVVETFTSRPPSLGKNFRNNVLGLAHWLESLGRHYESVPAIEHLLRTAQALQATIAEQRPHVFQKNGNIRLIGTDDQGDNIYYTIGATPGEVKIQVSRGSVLGETLADVDFSGNLLLSHRGVLPNHAIVEEQLTVVPAEAGKSLYAQSRAETPAVTLQWGSLAPLVEALAQGRGSPTQADLHQVQPEILGRPHTYRIEIGTAAPTRRTTQIL